MNIFFRAYTETYSILYKRVWSLIIICNIFTTIILLAIAFILFFFVPYNAFWNIIKVIDLLSSFGIIGFAYQFIYQRLSIQFKRDYYQYETSKFSFTTSHFLVQETLNLPDELDFFQKVMFRNLSNYDKTTQFNYQEVKGFSLIYSVADDNLADERELRITLFLKNNQSHQSYILRIADNNHIQQVRLMQQVLQFLYTTNMQIEEYNSLGEKTYLLRAQKDEDAPLGYARFYVYPQQIMASTQRKVEAEPNVLAIFWYKMENSAYNIIHLWEQISSVDIFHHLGDYSFMASLLSADGQGNNGYFRLTFKIDYTIVTYSIWIENTKTIVDMQLFLKHFYDREIPVKEKNSLGQKIYLLYPQNGQIDQKYLDLIDEIGENN